MKSSKNIKSKSKKLLIVDGYNVLSKFLEYKSANLETKRDLFINLIYKKLLYFADASIIVFDGPEYNSENISPELKIIFSHDADTTIERLCYAQHSTKKIILVTSDTSIYNTVQNKIWKYYTAEQFLQLIR